MREIILPEAKPALEWVRGRVLQKVSPRRKHALAQMRFATALEAWAESNASGTVGTEWEFRLQPPGEVRRPLVPDVGYISFERLPFDESPATDMPPVAPDAVVEVLSPADRHDDVDDKLRVYLATGVLVVFLVDTKSRRVYAHDCDGVTVYQDDDKIVHSALPGFSMAASRLFEPIRPRRSS
jgi:Uma2 family endonuclease